MEIEAAKVIGAGLAVIGVIGSGIGIGNIFSSFIEAVGRNPAARGEVFRARFLGKESLIEIKMEFDGSILNSTVPGVFLPPNGTKLWVSVRRDRCFVFVKEQKIK